MNNPPRTCWHLVSNRWYSAITAYALAAATAMQEQGFKVIFSGLLASPAEAKAQAAGLTLVSLKHFGISQVATLRRLARRLEPDLIITYGGPEEFLCKALRGTPIPVIRFLGHGLKPRLNFWQQWGQRWTHSHTQALLTPSAKLAAALQSSSPGPPVTMIPLGMDTKRFQRFTTQDQPDRPQVVIFGRLDPIKGHAAFFEIFAGLLGEWLPSHGPAPQLHVVGRAANLTQGDLEQAAKGYGLQVGKDVRFTAATLSHPSQLLSAATLGVVSSLGSEEICRVAQEFLLCGTPIFVSGVGALEETLFTGAGLSYRGLTRAETTAALHAAITASVAETEASKAARAERARQKFALARMGQELKALVTAVTRCGD